MVKIYGLLTPNVLKPVLAAEELSINYEHVNVDLTKGEQKMPAHIKRHPFGMVPVLEHEGKFLWESNTITRYLGNFTENKLYPTDKWKRAQVEQWMDFASNHVGRYVTGIFFQRCVASKVFHLPINEPKVREFEENLSKEMPLLDKHLATNKYLTGNDYTLADVTLFSLVSPYKMANLELSQYKNFEKWYRAVKERPAVQKVLPKLPMPYVS